MGLAGFLMILTAGAIGLVVFVIACVQRKWKVAKWTVSITLATLVLMVAAFFAIMYLVWRPYDPTSEADLKDAYRADFEVPPPAGITVLKARQLVIGDSSTQWLLLKASPEEIEKHIAKGFTAATDAPNDFNGRIGPNAPKWWAPPTGHLQLYVCEPWPPNARGTYNSAAMGVDTRAGLIWFVATQF